MLCCDVAKGPAGGGKWVWKGSWSPRPKGFLGHEGWADVLKGAVPKRDCLGASVWSDEGQSDHL